MTELKKTWEKPLWQRNAEDNMSLQKEIEKNYDALANPRKQEALAQNNTKQLNASMPQSETSLFGTYTQNSKPQAFASEAKENNFYENSKELAQTAMENISPYIPTYYIGSAVANVQNKLPKLKSVLSDMYKSYKDNGLYEVGKKYAEPSVQRALEAKEAIAKLPISDINKHQYLSCIGATDGLLAGAETLGGGVYKEIQDTKDKITNPVKCQSYGGVFGVLQDAGKDLSNDVKGAWKGLWSDNPDECEELLPKLYRNKKYW